MRNIITIAVMDMAAFLCLVNAALINAGNLTSYNAPGLQLNKNDSNPTIISAPLINCYSTGTQWADLGNWQNVFDALQISGVMRVNDIPAGYHVCCTY